MWLAIPYPWCEVKIYRVEQNPFIIHHISIRWHEPLYERSMIKQWHHKQFKRKVRKKIREHELEWKFVKSEGIFIDIIKN